MDDRDREALAAALTALVGKPCDIRLRNGGGVQGIVEYVRERSFRVQVIVTVPGPDGKPKPAGTTLGTFLVSDVLAVIEMPAAAERPLVEPVRLVPSGLRPS